MFSFRLMYVTVFGILCQFDVVRVTILEIREQIKWINEEPIFIDILQKYVELGNSRLDVLQKFRDTIIENIALYKRDDDLARNPLAVFKTVKHLTVDFNDVAKSANRKISYDDTLSKMGEGKHNILFLDENHLYNVIRDLVHLKKVQNLTIHELMDGRLTPDSQLRNVLKAEDCFLIGTIAAKKHDHQTAVDWLQGCQTRFDNVTRDRADEILLVSALFVGDKTLIWDIMLESLTKNPSSALRDLAVNLGSQWNEWFSENDKNEWTSFKVCAGDYEDQLKYRNLRCRYNHHNSPFLTIAPLKEEMLSLSPKISVFREAIYDSEIERLKADSFDSFRLAKIGRDSKKFNDTVIDLHYRICRSSYLDNWLPRYESLWYRLEDISSLSMEESDRFQVIHYPVGGYIRVHKDYKDMHYASTDKVLKHHGNKITTALMYFNDVISGGETVFPRLKIKLKPKKGSVALWVNMKPDGSEDTRSRHAACPVIYGDKQGCIEWLRSKYQDHWVADARDDVEVARFPEVNPTLMCPRRTTEKTWTLLYVTVFGILCQFNVVQATILEIREQIKWINEEPILIDILQKYVELGNSQLDVLQKFRDTMIENIALYKRDDDLARNPLAVFKTVKHLTVDFNDVAKSANRKISYDDTISTIGEGKNTLFPDENHLYNVIRDLVHLRKVQNLTVQELMDGRLTLDSKLRNNLESEDCFLIGKMAAKNHDYQTAIDWLKGCESRFDNVTRDRADEILLLSTLIMGDETLTREIVSEILIKPSNRSAMKDLAVILGSKSNNWFSQHDEREWTSYKICAGDYEDQLKYRNLRCRYNHHNSPFLTIAPLKEEMLSLSPKISVFREAIYDSEIERLKADSFDSFRLAKIGGDGKKIIDSVIDLHYRICRNTYLDNWLPQYENLWYRLEDISSLSMEESDRFQIIHYPVGGYIRVHKDYRDMRYASTDKVLKYHGNKMSTALMYFNDVISGGETVFPHPKIKLAPKKGSVALWVNMKPDGSEDSRSRHAACPVIYGDKQGCVEWFRSKHQDHWVAEARNDAEVSRFPKVNPTLVCPRSTTEKTST